MVKHPHSACSSFQEIDPRLTVAQIHFLIEFFVMRYLRMNTALAASNYAADDTHVVCLKFLTWNRFKKPV